MSRKNRKKNIPANFQKKAGGESNIAPDEKNKTAVWKKNWLVILFGLFLALGAFGAGLK